VRRILALAVVAVLLAPAVAFGTLWDYASSFLTEDPPEAYYSQAAWSPWSAGFVSGGAFTAYDSYHLGDPGDISGGYHGAWFQMPGGTNGPGQQGAACKCVTDIPDAWSLGIPTAYYWIEPGKTVGLTGTTTHNSVVQWTAPEAGWYKADAVYTGQETPVDILHASNVSIQSGGTSLSSGTVSGFIGTAAAGYTDGIDGYLGPGYRSATCSATKYLNAGQSFLFVMENPTGNMSWVGDALTVQTTTPEPSSMVLLAVGLIGLLAYAWRKRK
jgi:hypothetical protein